MNKKIILLGCLVSTLTVFAQKEANHSLMEKLEKQRLENNEQFEKYWNSLSPSLKNEKEKEDLKSRVSFFYKGVPYYLNADDSHQNTNANIDFIHNGTIVGLAQGFTGEGLQLHQFDGGKIYNLHSDLGGTPATNTTPAVASTRVTNGEGNNVGYSAHATNVASMMASTGRNLRTSPDGPIVGNSKGVAPNANVEGYAFATTTLPGQTNPMTVHQKILHVLPHISNHSYGTNMGWDYRAAANNNLGEGWYWNGGFNPTNNESYDFQGTYLYSDQEYDEIVKNNPQLIIVKSAGNSFGGGPNGNTSNAYYRTGDAANPYATFTSTMVKPANNCGTRYDCIGIGSLAKNIIIVGSTNKITTNNGIYTAATDVVKSGFSSAGPRDDGGIKPDIAGVGHLIFSATYTSQNDPNRYTQGSGTSYSAPNVTGIIGLWDSIYNSFFSGQNLNAAKAKTLLLHSAQEAGNHPGPDAWFGWGFADAKKGAEMIIAKSNETVLFDEITLANRETFTREIIPLQNGPLKVTISWVDPAFEVPNINTLTVADIYNNRTSKLVNDLDLRIIDVTTGNTMELPWRLNLNNLDAGAERGDNTVDNVEQILIPNAIANRAYRIQVTHKGDLKDNAAQNFAILAEGANGLSLSTNELSKKVEATVFPTIAKEKVYINLSNSSAAKVSVFDASGKLVHQQEMKQKGAIDISSYTQGVYIVSIESQNGKVSKRFIKE